MTKKLIAALVLTIAGASMAYADKYTLKRDALPQQAQEMFCLLYTSDAADD